MAQVIEIPTDLHKLYQLHIDHPETREAVYSDRCPCNCGRYLRSTGAIMNELRPLAMTGAKDQAKRDELIEELAHLPVMKHNLRDDRDPKGAA